MVKNGYETKTAVAGGLVGGVAGGIAIASVLALLSLLRGDIWVAFKGAGYPFLGARAAAPGYDFGAIVVGLLSHYAVSIVWGILFGLLFYGLSRSATVIAGILWGIVVWAGMYFLVLPAVGLGEMAAHAPVLASIVQHMVFGAGVGVGFMGFQRPHVVPPIPERREPSLEDDRWLAPQG